MPRIGRLHIPGGYYHLMGRGLERRNILREEVDKRDFLERLGKALDSCEMQCFAWALMSNHYHLLVRVHEKPLSKLMASVLGGYASAYNRRNKRVGYVFQNRYKSILCDADRYLLELIRYIHLNPLRAGMLRDLDALARYQWTGHAGVLGRHRQKWHKVGSVLGLFGEKNGIARTEYTRFIGEAIGKTQREDFSGGGLIRSYGGWESLTEFRKEHQLCIGDERILGRSDFVEMALGHDKLAITGKTLLELRGWTLEKLIQRISAVFGVSEAILLTKARSNDLSTAKSLICYWGTEEIGLTCREIGLRLNISQQAVSRWVVKGKAYCEREKWAIEGELELSC